MAWSFVHRTSTLLLTAKERSSPLTLAAPAVCRHRMLLTRWRRQLVARRVKHPQSPNLGVMQPAAGQLVISGNNYLGK
jgi:hypothetical protein